MRPIPRAWAPAILSLLRIVSALLFLSPGLQKLTGFPNEGPGGVVDLVSRAGVVALIEVGGGSLLLVGFFTRLTAFLMAFQMAFAYFFIYAPRGFWPLVNGGELTVLYWFLFLYFAAAGAGPFSVDAYIAAHRARSRPSAYGLPYPGHS